MVKSHVVSMAAYFKMIVGNFLRMGDPIFWGEAGCDYQYFFIIKDQKYN